MRLGLIITAFAIASSLACSAPSSTVDTANASDASDPFALPELPPITDGSVQNNLYPTDSSVPNDIFSTDVNQLADSQFTDGSVQNDTTDSRTGPPYPIVLVHGFAGFTHIGPVNYFYNVARDLRAQGETVIEAITTPFSSAQVRGPMLVPFVDQALRESHRRKVILIAHSQGGLDARYLISTLGYGDRVAALVTVSTPHHGTRLGDVVNNAVPVAADAIINVFASVLGAAYNSASGPADIRLSLSSMSEASVEQFNRENPDDPRVIYRSWAGRSNRRDGRRWCPLGAVADDPTVLDNLFTPLIPLGLIIEDNDPMQNVNDGLVSVRSARWGQFMGCVPADHFDEIGQIAHTGPVSESHFNHLVFYRDIVRRLRADGL